MRNLFLLFFLLAGLPLAALAQVPFPTLAQPVMTFSFEDKDWGIAPTARPKRPPYHAPTPTSLPGARVIKTLELKELLLANKSVLVIDVLDSRERRSVPGSFWMSGAGDGEFYATEKARFAVALDKLTGADKARPLVFLCLNSECWLSYNASLHALEAGYTDVIWYRGGTGSWRGASLDWQTPKAVSW